MDTDTRTTDDDWPLQGIEKYHAHDVLCGRGGGTNHHPGNKRYRKMVEDRKVDYLNCKRTSKALISLDIVKGWREQQPPGRFLKFDEKKGLWKDIGDEKARKKTSQLLRENAPKLRQELVTGNSESAGEEEVDEESKPEEETKVPSTEGRYSSSKPTFSSIDHHGVREHSLGDIPLEHATVSQPVDYTAFFAAPPTVGTEVDEAAAAPAAVEPMPSKRMTSNQNETIETKRDLCAGRNSVKRRNLDSTIESTCASQEAEERLEAATASMATASLAEAAPLSKEERTTTLERIAMDLFDRPCKPCGNGLNSRSTTLDALNLDLDGCSSGPDWVDEPQRQMELSEEATPNNISTRDLLDLIIDPQQNPEEP